MLKDFGKNREGNNTMQVIWSEKWENVGFLVKEREVNAEENVKKRKNSRIQWIWWGNGVGPFYILSIMF